MNILAAFDKFKDSMSAASACQAATAGIREVLGEAPEVIQAPLTDGGEGFCHILTNAIDGHIEYHRVCGPLGIDLDAPLGWVDARSLPKAVSQCFTPGNGRIAIIEMASTAGLEQVPPDQRHPKNCTSRGVGELIRIAIAEGASAILLGIGGSATSDLGLGALEALGLQFQNSKKKAIDPIAPKHWAEVKQLGGEIDLLIPPIFIACDVDNPLLGPRGAAAVYGPQKGLLPDEIAAYDLESKRIAHMLCAHFDKPTTSVDVSGSGAAGGIGFGLQVAFNASFLPGFELVSAWLDLATKIDAADLILSGEGCIDTSSLSGKGPYSLALAADQAEKPCILLAGRVEDRAAAHIREHLPSCAVYSITPEGCPLPQALAEGAQNLWTKTVTVLRKHIAHDD
jgi:glycerate 2-kinase